MIHSASSLRAFVSSCLLLLLVAGCSPYTIRGRVVQSDFGVMTFVDTDDPRLEDDGVAGVEIKVYRDPNKPNTELIARVVSDDRGNVTIPLAAFGAGFLMEQWRISAGRGGYQSVDMTMPLPGAGADQRLLIMLSPGYSPPSRDDQDPMELYRQYR